MGPGGAQHQDSDASDEIGGRRGASVEWVVEGSDEEEEKQIVFERED